MFQIVKKITNALFTDGEYKQARRLVFEYEDEYYKNTGYGKDGVEIIISDALAQHGSLTDREVAIMNEAFMQGRLYVMGHEKEDPAEIYVQLTAACKRVASQHSVIINKEDNE